MENPIKVLIVDDSALIRQILSTILESDPAISVVGTAPDPFKARKLIKELNPDVLTLDIEMPKMNGIEFLEKIMKLRPMPVVMISSLTQNGAEVSLQALEIGAVDVIGKPKSDLQRGLAEQASEIISKVKTASMANVHPFEALEEVSKTALKTVTSAKSAGKKAIVVGASTGGVEALRVVLSNLPKGLPPIFIVQHMPKLFTGTFSARLDNLSEIKVMEAEDGLVAKPGHAYVAPGDMHLAVREINGSYICCLDDGPAINGHKPSVSVLFKSFLDLEPQNTIAVMLSGMGKDGAESMNLLRQAGSYNIGQDEKSCVVYGMPKAAKDVGAIDVECDLKKIADTILSVCMRDD